MVAAMTAEPLTHNPLSAVTAGVWNQRSVVHKVLPRHREAPAHWASSQDPPGARVPAPNDDQERSATRPFLDERSHLRLLA